MAGKKKFPPYPPFLFGGPMMHPPSTMPYPPGSKLEHPETWPAPTEKNLAKAYVPIQEYDKAYHPLQALFRGTLFPELYRPYKEKE